MRYGTVKLGSMERLGDDGMLSSFSMMNSRSMECNTRVSGETLEVQRNWEEGQVGDKLFGNYVTSELFKLRICLIENQY